MPFPTELEYVERAAAALGVKFPPRYVERLLVANGGECELLGEAWRLYPVFDDRDVRRAKRTCNDVARETLEAREWDGFPADAVAIGEDGAGNRLVLTGTRPGELGSAVFLWDHESGSLTLAAEDVSELATNED